MNAFYLYKTEQQVQIFAMKYAFDKAISYI